MDGSDDGLLASPVLERCRQGSLVVCVLLVVGAGVPREGHRPLATSIGLAVAIAGAIGLFAGRGDLARGRFAGLDIRWASVPAAACWVGVVLVENGDSHGLAWFVLLLITFWMGLAAGPVVVTLASMGAVLTFAAEWIWVFHDVGWGSWIGGTAFAAVVSLLVHHQLGLLSRLRAAQAELAERSRAEERSRIAHELHDVIAHSLTVSLLHLTSARMAVEHEPEDAARALAEAERVGRRTLEEVRATIGLLGDGGPASRMPVPGLDQLGELVDDMRAAGTEVSFDAEMATYPDVPETVGASAYRIVQEALTNASRHAPGAPVVVTVAGSPTRLEVTVDSAGAPRSGRGMGLMSMQERARAVGGTCTAGPGGPGWRVAASLPLTPEPSRTRG